MQWISQWFSSLLVVNTPFLPTCNYLGIADSNFPSLVWVPWRISTYTSFWKSWLFNVQLWAKCEPTTDVWERPRLSHYWGETVYNCICSTVWKTSSFRLASGQSVLLEQYPISISTLVLLATVSASSTPVWVSPPVCMYTGTVTLTSSVPVAGKVHEWGLGIYLPALMHNNYNFHNIIAQYCCRLPVWGV